MNKLAAGAAVDQDGIVNEAIGWMMAMREDELCPDERIAFDAWLAADERHQATWDRLEASLSPFQAVRHQPVSGERLVSAMHRERASRRGFMARGATGALAAITAFGIAERFVPLGGLGADYHTPTAGRARYELPDGSRLVLNARSSADLAFDGGNRGIALRGGTAFVDVAPSVGGFPGKFTLATGPLKVETSSGQVVVSHLGDEIRAISIDAYGLVRGDGEMVRELEPGSGFALANGRMSALDTAQTLDAASWTEGKLILHDRALSDLVDALRPYNPGVLSVASSVADMRVSGVFDLDAPDMTLHMLTRLFPISVLRIGPFFSRIEEA